MLQQKEKPSQKPMGLLSSFPYVVPGDVVDLRSRKKHSYAEAEAVKIHEYNQQRTAAFVPHYGVCGGWR